VTVLSVAVLSVAVLSVTVLSVAVLARRRGAGGTASSPGVHATVTSLTCRRRRFRATATVREVRMRALLQVLVDAARRLTGTGARHNAADEMEQTARRSLELEAQLGHVLDLHRPAA
jgi:uncharacterized MAPEG superfamily protein